MKTQNDLYDVIIIGSGPAGLSAAIYTARSGLKTLVFGMIKNSNAYKAHIFENYMAFEKPITGPYLMETSRKQAESFGTKFVEREVVDVAQMDGASGAPPTFLVRDTEEIGYRAKTLVICSGLGFKPSGIKREKEFTGKGVSFCATCDGPFFKKKNLVVVGQGNFAADEAVLLTSYTPNITILSHGKDFTINPTLKKALEKYSIATVKTARIATFDGKDKLEKLILADGTEIPVDGVFVALGVAGAADFATKLGIERNGAYIVADPRTGKTNVPGVFAAGDCTGGNAQAAKSSGEGCNAAISVIKLLKGVVAYVDYS